MTRRAAATILVVVILLFAAAPAAWAGLVDDIGSGVGDVLDGGDGSSQGSGSETEPSSDSGEQGVGDLLGDLTDPLGGSGGEEDPDPVTKIVKGVEGAFDDTQEQVDNVTNDPSGYVGGIGNTVDKKVRETKRSLKDKAERDRRSDRPSGSLPGSYSPAEVYGSHLAAVRAGEPNGNVRPEGSDPASTTETSTPGVFAEIGRVAVAAAEQVAFPLVLALMVGGFLMVQNRIDRRDPKLALAPIDSDHELLTFS